MRFGADNRNRIREAGDQDRGDYVRVQISRKVSPVYRCMGLIMSARLIALRFPFFFCFLFLFSGTPSVRQTALQASTWGKGCACVVYAIAIYNSGSSYFTICRCNHPCPCHLSSENKDGPSLGSLARRLKDLAIDICTGDGYSGYGYGYGLSLALDTGSGTRA